MLLTQRIAHFGEGGLTAMFEAARLVSSVGRLSLLRVALVP